MHLFVCLSDNFNSTIIKAATMKFDRHNMLHIVGSYTMLHIYLLTSKKVTDI